MSRRPIPNDTPRVWAAEADPFISARANAAVAMFLALCCNKWGKKDPCEQNRGFAMPFSVPGSMEPVAIATHYHHAFSRLPAEHCDLTFEKCGQTTVLALDRGDVQAELTFGAQNAVTMVVAGDLEVIRSMERSRVPAHVLKPVQWSTESLRTPGDLTAALAEAIPVAVTRVAAPRPGNYVSDEGYD